VNQLVLTGDLRGDPTFHQLLERTESAALFAHGHQDVPFDRVVDALGVERRLDRSPLFQVKLIVQNTPFEPLHLAGVELEPIPVEKGVAQQDLVVALWERQGALGGWANYSTDLFEPATVRGWLRGFDALLSLIVSQPSCRLERLRQSLVIAGKNPSTAQESKMKKPSLASFKKSPAATPVAGKLVERSQPVGSSLPLIFEPATDGVDLVEWLSGERDSVLRDLSTHGALFFRGFGVKEPEYFERFATTVCDTLFDENGEHPHESVSGNVYTPVFYSPAKKLLWHNENSFNYRWPGKIIFCSVQPAASGGETPVADSRQVYQAIDPQIRSRFEELGVLYRRNYGRGMGLEWQEVFQTDDRGVVEDYCRENRLRFHWRDDGGLRTECLRPAVIEHPVTGEKSWFNQAQHWHPACLDDATRESLTFLFVEEDLPRSCTFGDGSPIPDEHMHHILQVYERLEAVQRWGTGDVMLLDNVLCAHARNPYEGDRKLLVAMGDMGSFDARA
ncbi:MAG: TauD/TfdA family dioxygenase, partial [Acidobacteriota bacterium]|nr:TauD/TfdA family dioxygenase [Acidobacteriota bacterium]